jgi:hypothetical protein
MEDARGLPLEILQRLIFLVVSMVTHVMQEQQWDDYDLRYLPLNWEISSSNNCVAHSCYMDNAFSWHFFQHSPCN